MACSTDCGRQSQVRFERGCDKGGKEHQKIELLKVILEKVEILTFRGHLLISRNSYLCTPIHERVTTHGTGAE